MMIVVLAQSDGNWTAIASFLASLLAVIVALGATFINYLFFRSQIDPHVILYVKPDPLRASIILLVIENVGKGLARDVRFIMPRPLPELAFGFENAPMPKPMSKGPLITGIPALGPGATRIITWGQYGGLTKGLGNEVVDVTVQFSGDAVGPFDSKQFTMVCPIEIKSYEYTDASDQNYDKQTVDQLKNIARAAEAIANENRLQRRGPQAERSLLPDPNVMLEEVKRAMNVAEAVSNEKIDTTKHHPT